MAQSYLPDGECGVKDQVSRRFIFREDKRTSVPEVRRLSKNLRPLIRRRQTEIVSAGFPGGAGRFRHLPKPFLTFFTAVGLGRQ